MIWQNRRCEQAKCGNLLKGKTAWVCEMCCKDIHDIKHDECPLGFDCGEISNKTISKLPKSAIDFLVRCGERVRDYICDTERAQINYTVNGYVRCLMHLGHITSDEFAELCEFITSGKNTDFAKFRNEYKEGSDE